MKIKCTLCGEKFDYTDFPFPGYIDAVAHDHALAHEIATEKQKLFNKYYKRIEK